MADIVPIQGSQEQGKIRNPLGVIGLGIITLGIYSLVWYYKVNKEMAEVGKGRGTEECGTNPTTSLLALIPGALIIVPPFVSYYKACGRLSATERVTGTQAGMEPALLFLLMVVLSPVGVWIFQNNLNKALQSQAQGGQGGQLPPQPAVQAMAEPTSTPQQ